MKDSLKSIAAERVAILFAEAEQAFSGHPERSDRYVELARKIAMKARISIPRQFKRRYCPYCHHYWLPGKTVRIRTHKGRVIYTCLLCKKHRRFVVKR